MPVNRKKIAILTYPLSLLYGFIVLVRNILFDLKILKSTEFGIPVISVGNITVGGTGKTPHIEYLVRLLKDEFTIALLSRGYKRKTRDFIMADPDSPSSDIGDEPKQLKNKFPDVHVAVDRKRVHGIMMLQKKLKNLKVVLLDDAYQHRYVNPGVSILLIDYTQPVYCDHLLPYGNLRENKYEIRRADIIIITKSPKTLKPIEKKILIKELKILPYQFLYFTNYEYKNPEPVFAEISNSLNLKDIKKSGSAILIVTGIARPQPLAVFLKNYSKSVHEMKYPDHHKWTSYDLNKIKDRFTAIKSKTKYIFTTEKDAVRLRELAIIPDELKTSMYTIPVEVQFLYGGAKKFNADIIKYVRNNKKVNKLHK
jgi:tetraacyldisaccharide 4'-kinase